MRYAVITVDAMLTVHDRPGDPLRILQGAVGGPVDPIRLGWGVDAWVNDDGLLRCLPANPSGSAVVAMLAGNHPQEIALVGPVAFSGHAGEHTTGLSDAQLARIRAAMAQLHPTISNPNHHLSDNTDGSSREPPSRSDRPGLPDGQLRELVAAHLHAHPDLEFTPAEVANVLGRSRGAVTNALNRLLALGRAERTQLAPVRYRAVRG